MMIVLPTSEDMISLAKIRAKKMPRLKNSIRNGGGNVVGCLGEIALNELLLGNLVSHTVFDYDIMYRGGTKIEVKSKDTTVEPQADFEASLNNHNTKQKCDIYAFCRVKRDLSVAWLCGMIRKQNFLKQSRFLKKGTRDGSNGYIVKADCWNMYHYDLEIPVRLLEYAIEREFEVIE